MRPFLDDVIISIAGRGLANRQRMQAEVEEGKERALQNHLVGYFLLEKMKNQTFRSITYPRGGFCAGRQQPDSPAARATDRPASRTRSSRR